MKKVAWPKANFPGQNERFLKLEERYDQMKINFDAMKAALQELQLAVDDANKLIAVMGERIAELGASNQEDQAKLDSMAADVAAEANKLPRDAGASAGGITA